MKTFDLFLVTRGGDELDPTLVSRCLEEHPHVVQDSHDWTRFYYRNEDSGTTFFLLVDPQYVPRPPVEESEESYDDEHEHEDYDDEYGVEETDEEDDEDEDEDDVAGPIDTPPLTVNIPLFHPSFWAREAFDFVRDIQTRLELDAIDPHEGGAGGGEPGRWSSEDLFASWVLCHSPIYDGLEDKNLIERWEDEKVERYSTYCRNRAALVAAHANDGFAVPQLFTARHQGQTQSLCIWRTDEPVVLPKCDLVLLQRVREKRGLLGRRKKIDELVVPGESVWRILAPFSTEHASPAPVLIFSRADDPPAQLAQELEDLRGDSPDSAKRIPLGGIIDFEIPSTTAGDGAAP